MNIFPFGDIEQEKYDICIKYGLLEEVNDSGVWKLSQKCKDNYNEISFLQWLDGRREKPVRESKKDIIEKLVKL